MRVDDRVVQPSVGTESRTADGEPVIGKPRHRGARGSDSSARGGFELAPQLAERPLEDLLERARAEERDAPGRRVRQLRGATLRRSARRETHGSTRRTRTARAPMASRPARRSRDRAARSATRADATSRIARKFVSGTRPWPVSSALFVYGDAFDLPHREEQVGIEQRQAAEHAAQPADPPPTSTEVHDVGVLVREDQPQPVVGVADQARASGRRGRDLDRVEGNRRRPPVRRDRSDRRGSPARVPTAGRAS